MNIKQAMIIDIDNCFLDTREQAKYLPKCENPGREDWDKFQQHTGEYKVNPIVEDFMWHNILINGYYPIFVTAREDIRNLREVTEQNLRDRLGEQSFLLFMRKSYDYRNDVEVKDDLFIEVSMCCEEVVLAIDDKTEICELWQSKGIPTLQFRFGG